MLVLIDLNNYEQRNPKDKNNLFLGEKKKRTCRVVNYAGKLNKTNYVLYLGYCSGNNNEVG